MGEVKVHGVSFSPFSLRVEIALKMKGVEYEFVEEDMFNKSQDLIKYNPIYKKIPVFIHDGKSMAESLVILEYIDETWKETNPILPTHPFERAQARFWAKFIDDKLMYSMKIVMRGSEEEREKAKEEVEELLKVLENEVKGKKLFERNGNEIGYLDLVFIIVAYWIPVLLEAIDEEMLTRDKFPSLCSWADHLLGCHLIKEKLPHREELLAFYRVHIPALRANASKS